MSLIEELVGAKALNGQNRDASGAGGKPPERGTGAFPVALAELEKAMLSACAVEVEWPAQIAAAVYAGVDFAIANPTVAWALTVDAASENHRMKRYERTIGRFAGFIRVKAPIEARLPGSTDEALVAGIVGLVGDHIRIGRLDRLAELRPELVLLTLLPYLGFTESQRWANQVARRSSQEA
jgi:hypothetical protein